MALIILIICVKLCCFRNGYYQYNGWGGWNSWGWGQPSVAVASGVAYDPMLGRRTVVANTTYRPAPQYQQQQYQQQQYQQQQYQQQQYQQQQYQQQQYQQQQYQQQQAPLAAYQQQNPPPASAPPAYNAGY